MQLNALACCFPAQCMSNTGKFQLSNQLGASMGDLFWNKVAGVLIGGVLVVLVIKELGHILVPSHAIELDEAHTAYPVNWAAVSGEGGGEVVVEETGPVDYGVLLAAADLSNGERQFRRCASCHSVDEGGATLQGPNLWDIVGRAIGADAGFGYSGALPAGEWSYEALDQFIENPRAYAPGTAMNFNGLSSESSRINLIAYLREQSGNPQPLPAPLAAEAPAEEAPAEEAPMEDAPATDEGGEE